MLFSLCLQTLGPKRETRLSFLLETEKGRARVSNT